MKVKLEKLILILTVAAMLAFSGFAQTALTSTTTAEAVDGTETQITITSASGVAVGDIAYVDREAMKVTAVDTTNNVITVRRGAGGIVSSHASGRPIYIDIPEAFISKELAGSCTAGSEYPNYTPLINVNTGSVFTCTGSSWTKAVVDSFWFGDGDDRDLQINFDGNATNFSFGLDDSTDDLVFADETSLGTDNLFALPEVGTGTSVQRAIFYGANPASQADNDESYLSFFLEDDQPAQVEYGRLSYKALDVTNSTKDGQFTLDAQIANTLTEVLSIGSSAAGGTTGLATLTADLVVAGTIPAITVGDAGEEDSQVNFDGNAQDYHIGLDDTDDDLKIGLGTALGTTPAISIDENLAVSTYADITMTGTTPTITVGDAGAEDAQINFDGNALDYHVGLDDSTDLLTIGVGTALGTTPAITVATGPAVAIVDATLSIGGIAYEFPADDGDAGEQLQTNGSGALTWESAASRRDWKTNIVQMDDTARYLQAILSAPVYEFNYIEGHGFSSGKTYTGIMGDEAPWALHFSGVLDPVTTFGYTVGAIQELAAQVADLKAEIASMKGSKPKSGLLAAR